MKRLDHAELQGQLQDALRLEAARIPAAVDASRLAASLAEHLARFDVYDPLAPVGSSEDRPHLPLELPEIAREPASQALAPAQPAFGRWLLSQATRSGWIGDLARSARGDPGFPLDGDVEEVRRRLQMLQAPSDVFEALDDAELDWLAL